MNRSARAVPLAAFALLLPGAATLAAGPPFPEPIDERAVYDTAAMLSVATEAQLEDLIDDVEARTGAEIVVFTQPDPDISEDDNSPGSPCR